jgi:perosamine synthetase
MIPWAQPLLFGDEGSLVTEALQSTAISGGPFVEQFEADFAAYHGMPGHALLVSNGTTALELALRGLGIGPGDEIIVPGFGFAAAANMALACGATPVLADVTEDSWLLDPGDVARRMTARTRAIVAIHSYGNLCDMPALAMLAHQAGAALIEDCAESLLCRYDGRLCGTLGDVGTFSFQATKTITCGEGGLVLARDPALLERMRLIRSHGMRPARKYWHEVVGHNFRLTNLQAAVLCAQWRHLDELARRRVRLYRLYEERLSGRPGLSLPHVDRAIEPVMWGVAVRLDPRRISVTRDAVIEEMAQAGIETRPGFCPLSAQPAFAQPPLGRSERVAAQIISLPASPTLSADQVNQICDRLLEAVAPSRATDRC